METLEVLLSKHNFFKDFKSSDLKLLAGCAANTRFDTGQYIFRTGEEAGAFYVIQRGLVALEIAAPGKGPITVATLGVGDILGWSWLIPPYFWHFDARALELTTAVALDGVCLRNKSNENHELGYELLKRFAYIMEKRLEATQLQLLDIYK